jgi:hypothetical protein
MTYVIGVNLSVDGDGTVPVELQEMEENTQKDVTAHKTRRRMKETHFLPYR